MLNGACKALRGTFATSSVATRALATTFVAGLLQEVNAKAAMGRSIQAKSQVPDVHGFKLCSAPTGALATTSMAGLLLEGQAVVPQPLLGRASPVLLARLFQGILPHPATPEAGPPVCVCVSEREGEREIERERESQIAVSHQVFVTLQIMRQARKQVTSEPPHLQL